MSLSAERVGHRHSIVIALQRLGGRGTLGDLMSATGLDAATLESEVLPALSLAQGTVAVDEAGELVYSLGGTPLPPLTPGHGERARAALAAAGRWFFLGVLVTLLAVCFVTYAPLVLVIVVGLALAGGDVGGWLDRFTLLQALTSEFARERAPRRRRARTQTRTGKKADQGMASRPSEPQPTTATRLPRWLQRLGLDPRHERLGLVLARATPPDPPRWPDALRRFIFGPPLGEADVVASARANLLAFARAHDARLTATDVVALTALDLVGAEAAALDLAARYDGDIEVTEAGVLIYRFARLAASVAEDPVLISWIRDRQGVVSAADLADHDGVDMETARARLETLSWLAGAAPPRGDEGACRFDSEAIARLGRASTTDAATRTFAYAWERLETSPPLFGISQTQFTAIFFANGFNLLASVLVLLITVLPGAPDGSAPALSSWEDWAYGVLPFAWSLGVIAIPLARARRRLAEDAERLARNVWRVFVLALFHRLGASPDVTAADLADTLYGRPATSARLDELEALLDRAQQALDGQVVVEAGTTDRGGFTYRFERLADALRAVERERPDSGELRSRLGPIVFES